MASDDAWPSVFESWWAWWESPSWPWYDWFLGLSRLMTLIFSTIRIYITYLLTPVWGPEAEISRLKRCCAHKALDLVLSLKGYYIKAAQTLCGAGLLPQEFDDVFAVLLDQCPREPFDVIQEIVEAELGCALGDVFQEFEALAVAAASIGQVHFARLRDGTEVAVKVQYPEVERYFRMDIKGVEFVCWLQGMGEQAQELCAGMAGQFEGEFDYAKEAQHMRECAENVLPHFRDRVYIPLPLDQGHPASAKAGVRTLCTRKVLTMERLEGVPLRTHTVRLLETFARMNGKAPEELRKLQRARVADVDPALVRQVLTMGPVSERNAAAAIAAARLWNGAGRLLRPCGCSSCWPAVAQPLAEPLNGPRLARTLYEVHGHEIFQDGLYNSDPHAGNIFVLEDGRLGLLDYGAVGRLTLEERLGLARLIVAVADEDDDEVPVALFACGFESRNSDPRMALLLGYLSFHRGPHPDDLHRLAPKVGLPEDCDLMALEEHISQGRLDEVVRFPPQLMMLQRCCMVLSGTAMELGAGRLSSARMLRPQAAALLRQQCSEGGFHERSGC